MSWRGLPPSIRRAIMSLDSHPPIGYKGEQHPLPGIRSYTCSLGRCLSWPTRVNCTPSSCSELRTSARLLDNGTWSLLGFTENETCLLLIVWLLRTFGERQMMAQLIAKRWPVSPLIHKDFRACHPLLASGDFASATLNHQKRHADWLYTPQNENGTIEPTIFPVAGRRATRMGRESACW